MAIPMTYNIRSVLQRPLSTLTTAIGIGLTVTIFIGALALAEGFRIALVSTGSPDNALIMRKGADSEISSGIGTDGAAIVRANPAIAVGPDGRALASPDLVVLMNKQRLGQPGSSNVTVRGIEPAAFALRRQVRIVAGRTFTPGSDEVIVGQRIARRFANCRIGDRLQFQKHDFTVVGHFTAGGASFESEVWGDAAVLAPAFDRAGVFQSITVRLKDPKSFDAFKAELERDPRLQVQVKRESQYYADQSATLTNVIRFMGIFITAIMALGAIFGAMNTMYAAVQQRTREIATLLVLGFSPFSVMASFMFESVFLALIGGLIGCALALPVNGIGTSTTNFASFSEVAFAFHITPFALLAGLGFAAIMGVVGGFLPSLKAARQKLAVSLRAT